ncbi:MAG: NUDIX hydrolase [Ignavibacteria bacterium]|jgi:ADP-ribose pyrophosphatase|nr:NUDIX hydrolase [Ignavibacteria bacterium]MCU7501735.1 NUDIX hydrolase [Ignavibacteria bacterium]MCU7516858.1 NUDIX hydrolase [Ignavibacteria bacterium]
MHLKRWKRISQRTVIKNDHWSYRLDEFEIEGGSRGQYHYVHTGGSSMVIPVTDDGKILMVKQFRYLNQKESLEFPCGAVEEGLSFEENAIKELREETGFTASGLEKAGEFSPYTGASDEMCTVFIARGLSYSPLKADETEEFEIIPKSYSEIQELIDTNFIWDGLSLAAWLLAGKFLKDISAS